jgi:hypothetical protein
MKNCNVRAWILIALMLGTGLAASGQSSADIAPTRDDLLLRDRRSTPKLIEEIPQWAAGTLASSGSQVEAKAGSGGEGATGNSRDLSKVSVKGTANQHMSSRASQIEFWSLQGIMLGTTIAAINTTHNCLQAGSCTAIPDFLQSRTALYNVGLPMAAGCAILSYEMKKHGSRWWFLPSAVATGAAGLLTVHSVNASH